MNTDPDVPLPADDLLATHRHLRIDTERLSAGAAADRILRWPASQR